MKDMLATSKKLEDAFFRAEMSMKSALQARLRSTNETKDGII